MQLPPDGCAQPDLPRATLAGGLPNHPACRAEARRLRSTGAARLKAPGAAPLPGSVSGWLVATDARQTPGPARGGLVRLVFGTTAGAIGWPLVDAGTAPQGGVGWVRALG